MFSLPHNITSIDCFSYLSLNVVKIRFIVELTDRNISEVTLKINSHFCSWQLSQFASIRITTKKGIRQVIRKNKIKNEVVAHRCRFWKFCTLRMSRSTRLLGIDDCLCKSTRERLFHKVMKIPE